MRSGLLSTLLVYIARQGAINCHASSKSVVYSGVRDSQMNSPVHNAHGLAVVRQLNIVSPVSGLLFLRCPSTIFRRVRAIVVNSIKRVMDRWSRSNVGKEVLKCLPPFTHTNTAPAIPVVCAIGRAVASRYCAGPRVPFRRVGHAVAWRDTGILSPRALATASIPAVERSGRNIRSVATIATALPNQLSLSKRVKSNNNNLTKSLSGQIAKRVVFFACLSHRWQMVALEKGSVQFQTCF